MWSSSNKRFQPFAFKQEEEVSQPIRTVRFALQDSTNSPSKHLKDRKPSNTSQHYSSALIPLLEHSQTPSFDSGIELQNARPFTSTFKAYEVYSNSENNSSIFPRNVPSPSSLPTSLRSKCNPDLNLSMIDAAPAPQVSKSVSHSEINPDLNLSVIDAVQVLSAVPVSSVPNSQPNPHSVSVLHSPNPVMPSPAESSQSSEHTSSPDISHLDQLMDRIRSLLVDELPAAKDIPPPTLDKPELHATSPKQSGACVHMCEDPLPQPKTDATRRGEGVELADTTLQNPEQSDRQVLRRATENERADPTEARESNHSGDPSSNGCDTLPSVCYFEPRDPAMLMAVAKSESSQMLSPEHSSESTLTCAANSSAPNLAVPTDQPPIASDSNENTSAESRAVTCRPSHRHSTPIFPELLQSPSNTEVEALHSRICTSYVPATVPIPVPVPLPIPVPSTFPVASLPRRQEGPIAVLDEHIARLGQFCAAVDSGAEPEPQASSGIVDMSMTATTQFSISAQLGIGLGVSRTSTTNRHTQCSSIACSLSARAPGRVIRPADASIDEAATSFIFSTDVLLLRQQSARGLCFAGGFPVASAETCSTSTLYSCQKADTAAACSCWSNGNGNGVDADPNAVNASYVMNQLALKYLHQSQVQLPRIAPSIPATATASRFTLPSSSIVAHLHQQPIQKPEPDSSQQPGASHEPQPQKDQTEASLVLSNNPTPKISAKAPEISESKHLGDPNRSGCESLPSICFYEPRDPAALLADAKSQNQSLTLTQEPESSAESTLTCALNSSAPSSNPSALCTGPPPNPPESTDNGSAVSGDGSCRPSPHRHSTPIFPELLQSPSNTEVEALHSRICTTSVPVPVSTPRRDEGPIAVLDEHIARLGQFCSALDGVVESDRQQPSARVEDVSMATAQLSIAAQLGFGVNCGNRRGHCSSIARPLNARTTGRVSTQTSIDEAASSYILSTDLLLLRQQFARNAAQFAHTESCSSTLYSCRKASTACSCCWSNDNDADLNATNASCEMNQLALKYLPDSELSRIASSMRASRPTLPSSSSASAAAVSHLQQQHSRIVSHISSANATDSSCFVAATAGAASNITSNGSGLLLHERQQHSLLRRCGSFRQRDNTSILGSSVSSDFPSDVSLYGMDTTELSICTVGYLQRYGLLPTVSSAPSLSSRTPPRD